MVNGLLGIFFEGLNLGICPPKCPPKLFNFVPLNCLSNCPPKLK